MSFQPAFPKTPRGLKVTPSRPYTGPRSDETVSLMLTEAGLSDAGAVEIDEAAPVQVVVAQAAKPSWRSILSSFKAARGLT